MRPTLLRLLLACVLAACATPPPAAPARPAAPPGPALRDGLTPAWLPRARAPGDGAGFVLMDMPGGSLAARHVAPHRLPSVLAIVWPGQVAPPLDACLACVIGDFDGDGADEVLAQDGTDLVVFPADGGPLRFVSRAASLLDDGSDGVWLSGRACDWNGDGRADLALARAHDVLLLTDVLAGRWTGQPLGPLPAPPPDVLAPAHVVASCGDFDGDGLPDLVLALPGAGLGWCRNEGTAQTPRLGPARPLWPATPGTLVSSLQLHDVDGDGRLDVLVGEARPGPGGFVLPVPRPRPGGSYDPELALARRDLGRLLQARRRAALGFDEDTPIPPMLGNSAWPPPPMPAEERALRDRIDALAHWPVAMAFGPTRVLLQTR